MKRIDDGEKEEVLLFVVLWCDAQTKTAAATSTTTLRELKSVYDSLDLISKIRSNGFIAISSFCFLVLLLITFLFLAFISTQRYVITVVVRVAFSLSYLNILLSITFL